MRAVLYTAILALLLVPAPVRGQSLLVPSAIYVATGQIDAWSTVPIQPGQHEQNPFGAWLYAKGGTPGFVVGTLAADTATAYLVTHTIGRHHPTAARVTLYALTAMRGFFAARNIQLDRTYRLNSRRLLAPAPPTYDPAVPPSTFPCVGNATGTSEAATAGFPCSKS